jgi:DNA-binding NarL/FixJ family response regulator
MCVDDHRLMREGIRRIVALQPDMVVVAEASNGAEAVEQFQRHKPDVTLMDLQLPSMNGHEAIKAIRRLQPDARVVVLTMYFGDEDVYRAIEAGVMGYILKDTVPDDLIHVIREVHAGRRSVPPEIEAVLDARAMQPSLTAREFQVLQLLATGKRNKGDRGRTRHQRRHHQRAREEHLPEVQRARPHRGPRRSDPARHHPYQLMGAGLKTRNYVRGRGSLDPPYSGFTVQGVRLGS